MCTFNRISLLVKMFFLVSKNCGGTVMTWEKIVIFLYKTVSFLTTRSRFINGSITQCPSSLREGTWVAKRRLFRIYHHKLYVMPVSRQWCFCSWEMAKFHQKMLFWCRYIKAWSVTMKCSKLSSKLLRLSWKIYLNVVDHIKLKPLTSNWNY